jgi:hypothetical protein
LKARPRRLERLRAPRDVPARAHARDQPVEARGKVLENLARRAFGVHAHVRGVVELRGHPRLRHARRQLLARAIAPFMPSSRGVSSNVAPYAAMMRRRSIDIDSGITSTSG